MKTKTNINKVIALALVFVMTLAILPAGQIASANNMEFNPGSPAGTTYNASATMAGLELLAGSGFGADGQGRLRLSAAYSDGVPMAGEHVLRFGFEGTGIEVNMNNWSGHPYISARIIPGAGGAPVFTTSFPQDWEWGRTIDIHGLPNAEYVLELTFTGVGDTNIVINNFVVFAAAGPLNPGSPTGIWYQIHQDMPGFDHSGAHTWMQGSNFRLGGPELEHRYRDHTLLFQFHGTGIEVRGRAISGDNPITATVRPAAGGAPVAVFEAPGSLTWGWYFDFDLQGFRQGEYVLELVFHTFAFNDESRINFHLDHFVVYDTGPDLDDDGTNRGTLTGRRLLVGGPHLGQEPHIVENIPGLRTGPTWWPERQMAVEHAIPITAPHRNSLRVVGDTNHNFEFDFYGTGIEVGLSSFNPSPLVSLNIIPFEGDPSDVVASHSRTMLSSTLSNIEHVTSPELMDLPLGRYTVRGVVSRGDVDLNVALLYFIVWDESSITDPRVLITDHPMNVNIGEGAARELTVASIFRNVPPEYPRNFAYQWYATNASGEDAVAISGANGATLDLSQFPPGDHHFVVVISCDGALVPPAIPATSNVAFVRIFDLNAGRTFYVAADGNDAADGLTPQTAWRTVDRVNQANGSMIPGDSVLFRRGDVWVNDDIQGNGSSFIHINTGGVGGIFVTYGAWGDPNLPKPVINGSGRHNTIIMSNVEFVRLQELRIINNSVTDGIPQRDRRGIMIWAGQETYSDGDRWARGFEFINIEVTNIDGWVRHVRHMNDEDRMNPVMNMAHLPASLRNSIQGNWWGSGVLEFNTGRAMGARGAGFKDVLIDGSYFFDFGSYGIRAAGDSYSNHHHDRLGLSEADAARARGFIHNFWMRNSVMRNTGQDSFNVYGGSAEFSAFYDNAKYYITTPQAIGGRQWEWTGIAYVSDGSIHQFNEYSRAWYDGDSMSLDSDIGAVGTVLIQYNYSHDMDGGFWMQWPTAQDRQTGQWTDGPDMAGVIIRYNIIVNDGGYWGYAIPGAVSGNAHVFKHGDSNALIYNNTIFKNNGFWIGISNDMPRVGHPTSPYGVLKPAGAAAWYFNNLFVADNVGDTVGDTYSHHVGTGFNNTQHTIAPPPSFHDDATIGVTGERVVALQRLHRAANYGGSGVTGGFSAGEIHFNNNVFWSHTDPTLHPGVQDPNALIVDPMFVGMGADRTLPGAAGFGTSKWDDLNPNDRSLSINRTLQNHMGIPAILAGDGTEVTAALHYLAAPFMIQDESPLVGAGIEITYEKARELLGDRFRSDLFHFGKGYDFFGNPVPTGTAPTIGAHEPLGAVARLRAETPEIALLPTDGTAIYITNYSAFASAVNGIEFLITPGDMQWRVYNHAEGITGLDAISAYSIIVRHIGEPDLLQSFASQTLTTARRGLSSSLPMSSEPAANVGANEFTFYGVGFEVTVSAPGTLEITIDGTVFTINAVPGAVYYFDVPGATYNAQHSVTITGTATVETVTGYALMIPATPILAIDPASQLRVSLANISDYNPERFGALQYSLNGGTWLNYEGRILGVSFGNNVVRVRYAGNDRYIQSMESLPSATHTATIPTNALPIPYTPLAPAPATKLSAIRQVGDNWDEHNFITWDSTWGAIDGRNGYGGGIMGGGGQSRYTVNFRGTAIEVTAHLQNSHTRFAVILNDAVVGYYNLARLGNVGGGTGGFGYERRLNFRIDGLEYGDHVLEAIAIAGSWSQVNAVIIYGEEIVPVAPVITATGGVARIANLQTYATQSLHTDLDGSVEWVFGALQYSLNGGEWNNYNDSVGIPINASANNSIRVRYAGTDRVVGDEHIYRFANFTPSEPSSLTLWTPGTATQRTITFNANGGTGTMPNRTVAGGANFQIPANAFTRLDHNFTGWNTVANGSGIAFAPGATITNVQTNITLFAQWTPIANEDCEDCDEPDCEICNPDVTPPREWLPPQTSNPFIDVPNSPHWQNDPVSWAARNGIAAGIANTSPPEFRPNNRLTRETFATFLHRVVGEPEVGTINFTDNASISSWATDAVRWAVEAGVVLGFADNTFRPQAIITREQIATMLFRFAEYLDKDLEFETATFNAFPDSGQVSTWALEAMQWATDNELITGIARPGGPRLEPQGSATRAQAVAVIYRFVMEFEVEPPPE